LLIIIFICVEGEEEGNILEKEDEEKNQNDK
jgi:hypothetical protein